MDKVSSNLSYDDLLSANPYRDFDYRQSWWQNFISKLGFRTNYDAYKESMSLNAKEYDAEVLNKAKNEQYETPLQEADRMRQAGLNPDLQGLSDVQGASAPDIGDENPPVSPESDEGTVLQFANICMSAVTMAFGLGKDFQSLRNMGIVNRAGEIENTSKVADFAKWITDSYFLSPEALNSLSIDSETGDEISPRIGLSRDLYNQYYRGIPLRYRRQFARNIATGVMSFQNSAKSYETGLKFLGDKRDYAILRGRKSFEYGLGDDAIMSVVKPLSELADKVEKTRLEFDANKAEFDKELYDGVDGLNPKVQASSQNQIASNAGQSAQIQREIDSAMKDIVHNLKKNADKGDFFSKMLLLSFSLQRLGTGVLGNVAGGLLKSVF